MLAYLSRYTHRVAIANETVQNLGVNNWTVPFAPVSAAMTLNRIAPIQATATIPPLALRLFTGFVHPQVLDGLVGDKLLDRRRLVADGLVAQAHEGRPGAGPAPRRVGRFGNPQPPGDGIGSQQAVARPLGGVRGRPGQRRGRRRRGGSPGGEAGTGNAA